MSARWQLAPAPAARSVHVEHCMGTVFSIDVRDVGHWHDAFTELVGDLHRVDAVFSTYRPDSDISRIRRGELRPDQADPMVHEVLDVCAQLQLDTGGAFTAMPDGRLDPTGMVKGWAVERASAVLRRHGSANHAVNGGGDIQLVGEAAPGRPWTVGISDPLQPGDIRATVSGRDLAVATSGTAERGAHIRDPFTGRAATPLASVTVTGPSLVLADAYATAAFVLGRDALSWIRHIPGYEMLLIDPTGRHLASAGWPQATTDGPLT